MFDFVMLVEISCTAIETAHMGAPNVHRFDFVFEYDFKFFSFYDDELSNS